MIFFFRRKRSAWRERDARDLLRDNVHIQPSAPVMRWPHPRQVVFVSSLAPGTQAAHLMHARHWTPRKWEPRTWLRRRMDRGMQGWWFYHHFLAHFPTISQISAVLGHTDLHHDHHHLLHHHHTRLHPLYPNRVLTQYLLLDVPSSVEKSQEEMLSKMQSFDWPLLILLLILF